MTDLELRRKVAEAVGWTETHATGGLPCGIPPGKPSHEDSHDVIPAYETDIAAAWELVEAMATDGNGPKLGYNPRREGWHFNPTGWMYEPLSATAPTAPRAICLAYLAWKAASEVKQ